MSDDRAWISVGDASDVPEGETLAVMANGIAVALYNVDGTIYATQAHCTHGNAELADGFLDGREIICPYHQGRFDVRTGEATAPPCVEPLLVYTLRIEAGKVLIRLGGHDA